MGPGYDLYWDGADDVDDYVDELDWLATRVMQAGFNCRRRRPALLKRGCRSFTGALVD